MRWILHRCCRNPANGGRHPEATVVDLVDRGNVGQLVVVGRAELVAEDVQRRAEAYIGSQAARLAG